MKNIYTFLFALMMTSFGYSQIISQYIETDSGTTPKGIEIWNNTGATLDFSTNNLVIEKGSNGGTPSTDFTLSTGTLAAGEVIVIGTSDMETVTLANGSVFHVEPFSFNGDDSLVVKYGGTITDMFGTAGSDPGSSWTGSGVDTRNQNIELNTGITTGDTDGWADPSTRFSTVNTNPSGVNGDEGFGIAPSTGSGCTAPTIQAHSFTTLLPTSTDVNIEFTRGGGDDVLVVMKEASAVDTDPTNGTSYTANSIFNGAGASEIGTGNYVVFNGNNGTSNPGVGGASLNISVTGLTPGSAYHLAIYEYNTTGTCYLTPAFTGNFTTPCSTPDDVAGLAATAGNATVDLSWTNGACFDEILVVAKAGSAVTNSPSGDGTAYTANAAFGSGTDLGSSEYVVYKGTGTSLTVTGLTNGTTYHFEVFARKVTTWSAGVIDSATPSAPTLGWQITAEDTSFVIDFDTTVSGVNEGAFDATGFTTSPSSGQLDSDAWEATGMSDGSLSYGGSETIGDYARGTSSGGVTSGGFYAFDTGSGNSTLGFQGTGSDFTPGTITLRAQNQTGNTVTEVDVAYLIYLFNDQGRGNTMNFSYSTDDVTYTDLSAMDFTSEEIADGVPAWVSNSRSTSISGLSIADGGFLYLRWSSADAGGSGSRDEFALDDIDLKFNPAAPTTYTFNGTWSPSDPNGAATASDDIVITSGDATIDTNTTCNSVTVNAGAGLTVDSGVTLTTSNGLSLESTSTSYSSLILDGTVTGTLTYDRHVNINGSGDTGSNDLISAPLTGQAFNLFEDANPNILSDNEVTPTFHLFGPFDKTIGEYVVYADSETATLDPGIGYRAASNDNSTFTFTGTANNGNINVGISNSGPSEEEWNLIGNPYPSYINVQDFLNHEVSPGVSNLSLFDAGTAAIYGYDGDALNGWTIYNLATTTPSTVITPGQGFFVSSANASATLQFTPAMRSTGTSDDFIAGRQGVLTYMTLQISTASDSYTTDVYFNDNASLGFDFGFDAEFFGAAPPFALYTLLVEENEGNPITLQAVNTTDLGNTTIPLGVNANQGEQLTFTISVQSLPSTTEVYLEDTLENTSTLLTDMDYVITPSTALSGTGRFFLRFYDDSFLSTNESIVNNLSIAALDATNEILVSGQLQENTVLNLYDIQGRIVLSTKLEATNLSNRIDVSSLSAGVYVAQVLNNGQQKSQKVIIN